MDDMYDLSDSEYEEAVKQLKKESEEEVAPAVAAIKSKLEPLAERLDRLIYE